MRLLTKSRFRLACECPTKLFYTGKESEYADASQGDTFLAALAEGGFQVGALAKAYHPGGVEIEGLNSEKALADTTRLMERENIVLFEPAFRVGNLLVRVDILVKVGNTLRLIEVKAKSWDAEDSFLGKKGDIVSGWRPYIEDLAFQTHVVHGATGMTVAPFLMLADKDAAAIADGLNQKFLLSQGPTGRAQVEQVAQLSAAELANRVLVEVPADAAVRMVLEGTDGVPPLDDLAAKWSAAYAEDRRIPPVLGAKCAGCQFKAETDSGLKCGFTECWSAVTGATPKQLHERPLVLQVWSARDKDKWIKAGKYWIDDLTEDELKVKEGDGDGLSPSQRQWEQVSKVRNGDDTVFLDIGGLRHAMSKWNWPLHHIDFETSMTALPFHAGRHPYEQIAFQFSHHVMHQNGRVEHRDQFLMGEPGEFPNYAFLRALKTSLEGDEGTIFRYSNHENTVLNQIAEQLRLDPAPPPDHDDLIAFVHHITKPSGKSDEDRDAGPRCMVDLWAMVKKYHYDPATCGSNSIKKVLPAILSRCPHLRATFSAPVYGDQFTSLNFGPEQVWLTEVEQDPYGNLPKLENPIDQDILDQQRLMDADELRDGGAAMTAFARMQFTQMTEAERTQLQNALLRYCELDTLAMVMIVMGWRELMGQGRTSA